MGQEYPLDFQKAIAFHGHVCPGLAIGYRAAKAAAEKLQVERAEDEELLAIVETDACGVDAVQALLGCTMGKGNLIYKDYGKQAYTVASRKSNAAVRVVMRNKVFPDSPEQDKLRAVIASGRASEEQHKALEALQKKKINQVLTIQTDKLFKVEQVTLVLPEPAKIFKSVICDYCGEAVMEPRARLKDGKIAWVVSIKVRKNHLDSQRFTLPLQAPVESQ